ncbi:hypothetical protein Pmani_013079 [Petrolisthes manimaculis]|uniref:Uncharacterized protein n=1 Tax=Petrolisthes manimaculis TaxID=1843537 RepID=A0AAE1UE00_9EUCA|nr:hypothetical protein Pmani_013079 [Petrolisthes manimaculis]
MTARTRIIGLRRWKLQHYNHNHYPSYPFTTTTLHIHNHYPSYPQPLPFISIHNHYPSYPQPLPFISTTTTLHIYNHYPSYPQPLPLISTTTTLNIHNHYPSYPLVRGDDNNKTDWRTEKTLHCSEERGTNYVLIRQTTLLGNHETTRDKTID